MQLDEQTVVVTGAAQGIGRAIAVALAARRAHLALVDLSVDALEETEATCQAMGGSAESFALDVSSEKAVCAFFKRLSADRGAPAGLVNNAGITRDAMLVKVREGEVVGKMSATDWQAVIDVNLSGVFLCAREAAAQMIRCGMAGMILNISSVSRAGNVGQGNYAAAKAGVAALTVTWAKELARHGIRCAAIAPGVIRTDMVADMKPEAREKLASGIPLGRLGEPEEVAELAVHMFLNDYCNGRVVELDGGLRL